MQSEMRRDGSVDWGGLPPPARGVRCVVILPARNEALLLPRALQAIAQQTGASGLYEVLVLANNCSDDTAERARAFAATCSACAIHVVSVAWPKPLAHVGRARRALMDEAARRVGAASARRGVVLSTDADSRVASDWVATTLAAIDQGADAVGGRIVTDPDPALPADARRLMRLDDSYRSWRTQLESLADPDPADPWPRHHQHFGASLAVTAEAYGAVGGLPLVRYLEDEALVQALRLHDRSLRHSLAVRVRTSARLDGRAEVGLSWQLREWADSAHAAPEAEAHPYCPAVPEPAQELRMWRLRRSARELWGHVQAAGLAAGLATASTAPVTLCQRWLDSAVDSGLDGASDGVPDSAASTAPTGVKGALPTGASGASGASGVQSSSQLGHQSSSQASSQSGSPSGNPSGNPSGRQVSSTSSPVWPSATRLARDMRAASSFGSVWAPLEAVLRHHMAAAVVPMDQALLQLRALCAEAARPAAPALSRGSRAVASDRRRGDQMF